MMTIGLEKEYFVLNADGEVTTVPHPLPHDGCGWLFEARGLPSESLSEAIFSLQADEFRLRRQVASYNQRHPGREVTLHEADVMVVPKAVRINAGRVFAKSLIGWQNLYGHIKHRVRATEATAGLHVSFTKKQSSGMTKCQHCQHAEHFSSNVNFDWASVFMKLDKAFEPEIKAARRNKGFYEVKNDGRIEYRSLPSSIDQDRLYDVLMDVLGIYYIKP